MGFWAAIPAIASVASMFLGNKKKESTSGGQTIYKEPQLTGYQYQGGNKLIDFMNKYFDKFTPGAAYPGQFTAGITGQEKTSLDMLTKLLGASATGELFGAGKNQLLDTLAGKFADPTKSPFIQSMTKLSTKNLEDMIDVARRQAGARGAYYTDSAIREEGDIRSNVANYLDTLIGQFVEKERGRQFQAAPLAATMDEYEKLTAPLKQITAGQTLGGLERTIEQGDLEKRYQDFLRQKKEEQLPLQTAETLYGQNTRFDYPSRTEDLTRTQQPSTLDNIVNLISKLNWNSLQGSGSIWNKLGGLFKT